MALENYTGKIADLVVTNPTPTDPKSQGDDHLRGIKKTIVDDAVRVSGSPLQQLGASATASENHHWDASVQNQLTLKRGTPDAPGVELIKALNGVLSFPSQGQSLAANGYVKLPGGLIIQWGSDVVSLDGGGNAVVPYPIPFTIDTIPIVSLLNGDSLNSPSIVLSMNGAPATSVTSNLNLHGNIASVTIRVNWIALGY